MIYVLFLVISILYNLRKVFRDRVQLIKSMIEAQTPSHREMILSHHFYVFTFESFLALVVAHLISEKVVAIGLVGMAIVYVLLLVLNYFIFQHFLKFLERQTSLVLRESFNQHLIKEIRVNFALIMLPIVIYSSINWASQDGVMEEWGSFWLVGIMVNVLFVSVLTIICSVIVMLRLIPNREISEPEYLDLINRRLNQIGMPNMRVRWIEADLKNAFVVGLKLLWFSNQTMFIGRSVRTTLTPEEFDAVVAHELGHVANRHIHKRVINLLKNFISIVTGALFIVIMTVSAAIIFWGEEISIHNDFPIFSSLFLIVGWFAFNYAALFDGLRAHELEADAYAVINLGASYSALKSALQKLNSKDEMPEYLKAKVKNSDKNAITKWLAKVFSTHPDIDTRMGLLKHKIENGLAFNSYISPFQKMRNRFWRLFHWKTAVPLMGGMLVLIICGIIRDKNGDKMVAYVSRAPAEEILKDKTIVEEINHRHHVFGKSLIYYVVQRKDEVLIDHFLALGAHKGKTLGYLAETGDIELFRKYYTRYQNEITDDEFYLILEKTARKNFTEGYRLLVNGKRFEKLNLEYKESISIIRKLNEKNRVPASVQK